MPRNALRSTTWLFEERALPPRLTRPLVPLVITVAILSTFASCANKETPSRTAAKALAPVEIAVAPAAARQLARSLRATGSFAPDDLADIAPQIAEKIIAIPVVVGQFVEKGAVLVQLDRANMELRLRQVKAAEEQSQAALLQAESRLGLTAGSVFDVNQVPE